MHEWTARLRCDAEEFFCTETYVFNLDTYVLSEAAKIIENQLDSHLTLFELIRTDI